MPDVSLAEGGLSLPNLDDRRFQDFVDDAKRLVQRRCPEWTDHNVHDPGVTLIEAFAQMADQIVYRLNRVPDRLHLAFLDLIGLRPFPAAAARAPVTLWLSTAQPAVVHIPAGTAVATRRSTGEEPVLFETVRGLDIVPTSLATLASVAADGTTLHHDDALALGSRVRCFQAAPAIGDALLVGLSQPAPSCVVALRVDCDVEGVGVDPRDPPLRWEAWTGQLWEACEVDRDDTGGLNRPGAVVLHLPAGHVASLVGGRRAGWVRACVVPPRAGLPSYSDSPWLTRISASTVGGTVDAVNARAVREDVLGLAEGVPGQVLATSHAPVLPADAPLVLEVSEPPDAATAAGLPVGTAGWQEWTQVEDFAGSGEHDRHFVLDAHSGHVRLGPSVLGPDGRPRHYGAVPAAGATLRLRSYRTGGGAVGNVSERAIAVLRSSIPYVTRVENRRPARGGRDAESLEEARLRGPIWLRTRNRAVTAADYEEIARRAAPEVARVRCVPPAPGDDVVRVLLVPAVNEQGRVPFADLQPTEASLAGVAAALDERRVVAARIAVEPPRYRAVTVVAQVRARRGVMPAEAQSAALSALYRYLHPVHGGPDGAGWPFGRPVHYGEIFNVLQSVPLVDLVEDVRLFPADPTTGRRDEPVARIETGADSLLFSYDHQVHVAAAPGPPRGA